MKIEKGIYTYNNWDNNISTIAYEINLINEIYFQHFDSFDVSKLTVSFDTTNNSSAPICYKQTDRIVLNANIIYWCQVAYQYCHELCHYCISGYTSQKFKWLEESICELASVYFMDILAERWATNIIFPEYSTHIKNYAQNVLSNDQCAQFNLIDLTNNSEIFNMMAKNQYYREYNRTVAKALLNVFKKVPTLCNSVSRIGLVNNNQSLREFLNEWGSITNSPDLVTSIFNSFIKDEISSLDNVQ